jgi:ubiquitin C-terminal hydrolase
MPKSKSKDTLPPPPPPPPSSRLLIVRNPLQLFQGIVKSTQRLLVTMHLRGGNRQARTSKKRATIPLGQSELEQLLALAEYELDHDPYRGIGIPENITTPWNRCTWGMLQEDLINTKDPSPEVVLRHVCQCACPSLIAWTKQQQKQKAKNKSKKRSRNDINRDIFQVGARGVNAVCICDFNPLCLGSLGGLINDILQERSDQVLAVYEQDKQDKETPLPSPPPPASEHPKIIDLDADTTQSIGTSLSEEKDPLEFTGEEVMSTTKLEPRAIAPLAFETKKRDSSLENPNLVFTEEHSTSHNQIITYSKTTQESLDRLRRSLPVQDAPIRSYIYRTLQIDHTNDNNVTLDSYVQKLRQWHKSLLFVNPMKEDDDNNNNAASNSSNRLSISIPPGIQNLGATCYLNTQLQCLAQNTAFLQGIFSWRQATSSDDHGSMNSVMSKLQYLLAQMVVGGDNKLSTLDFSNALGLEHDEQQDPNEFARLLFQRMDESFNNCGDSNLSNLLQRLFHGVTTYETTCMTCQATSARQEGFMDLNLPIVQETTTTTKTATKNVGQISILEALKGTKDTNVQYCLDQYTCAEMLDGDNQYHCSSCNAKRDVQRVLKFTELPPVLNIQLSRYVFDREKCVKKKLTDKVLLPTVLNASKKRYLLCAVMRHQGTSAYRGHYVAEAMDWLTGQWFEFNDATVKLLPDGPSRSYDPSLAEGETTTKKKLEGSQDAYNMYYVEDSFLAKHATSSLLKKEQLLERVNNSSNQEDYEEESKDVLVKVAKQRDTKYALLGE